MVRLSALIYFVSTVSEWLLAELESLSYFFDTETIATKEKTFALQLFLQKPLPQRLI